MNNSIWILTLAVGSLAVGALIIAYDSLKNPIPKYDYDKAFKEAREYEKKRKEPKD